MSTFMLLYRGGAPAENGLSRQQMQEHMRRWDEWVEGLAERGVLTDAGRALGGSRRVVGPEGVVVDGPFAESKEVVGGYSLIEVRDLSEATVVAESCPIREYGGRVEIRPVVERCLDSD